ncbi:complement factor H-like [Puntigrus tetrazona]|uniref:complement factor H-like n=1 Tax=Puntigrus tetrazona TaxID=1606681 RepID=UPI001C8ABCD0|nr:complement factor H-like [Puntigrus tetrazona]
MRVTVKLLGFGFWLLYFDFACCQECRRDDIKFTNTESVAKASYADGETMKVNCITGFTGLYKLKCEKGEWKKSIQRPCAKRKCGHPGDLQHGDFKLVEGTEFVFGATVAYSCQKGYEMTSRINQRTCRAQGWDNAVPICEVVKCPAVYTEKDITASGDTEEGSYGDIIHFECASPDKMLNGSSEIHCEETGEWSDVIPKCIEITCTAPVISHGKVVEPRPKYLKNSILKYKCDPGFKAKEGIPRCAKSGWTVSPECDEITCELKSTSFGVQKINPKGKTIFRAGESVEITCSEEYFIFGTKEASRSFTCRYNGQWDNKPACEEITCEDPRDWRVSKPYYWQIKKFGEKQSYRCESRYRETAEVATCTRDGWKPKPLCADITCTAPVISNGNVVEPRPEYHKDAILKYRCDSGSSSELPGHVLNCVAKEASLGHGDLEESNFVSAHMLTRHSHSLMD